MNLSGVGVADSGERLGQCDPTEQAGKGCPALPTPTPTLDSSLTVLKGLELLGHHHLPPLPFEAHHPHVDNVS